MRSRSGRSGRADSERILCSQLCAVFVLSTFMMVWSLPALPVVCRTQPGTANAQPATLRPMVRIVLHEDIHQLLRCMSGSR